MFLITNTKNKKNKGFTLLELMIAMFIFLVVMVAALTVFASLMRSYKVSRNIQNNLENAQFALNSMAKIIRESEIVDSTQTRIEVYNSNNDKCYGYRFDSSNNVLESGSITGQSNCGLISYNTAVNNVGDISFFITQNSSTQVGHVTILIKLCSDASCSKPDKMNLQTSVSLRNY